MRSYCTWFRATGQGSVLRFSGSEAVGTLSPPSTAQKGLAAGSLDPARVLGSVPSEGSAASLCNEEAFCFTPSSLSGQHMHN